MVGRYDPTSLRKKMRVISKFGKSPLPELVESEHITPDTLNLWKKDTQLIELVKALDRSRNTRDPVQQMGDTKRQAILARLVYAEASKTEAPTIGSSEDALGNHVRMLLKLAPKGAKTEISEEVLRNLAREHDMPLDEVVKISAQMGKFVKDMSRMMMEHFNRNDAPLEATIYTVMVDILVKKKELTEGDLDNISLFCRTDKIITRILSFVLIHDLIPRLKDPSLNIRKLAMGMGFRERTVNNWRHKILGNPTE